MKPLNINLEINKEDFKKKLNIKDGYTPVKGKDYFDGEDGENGKDAVVDYDKLYNILSKKFPKIKNKEKTPEEIIKSLKGKLSYYDLEDLPELKKISARDYDFLELKDVPKSYKGSAGKIVKVKADESGLEFTDDETGTDEKVKYDSEDPTAGYLANKILAGAGITLSEGIGANANKLVITNSDRGSDVDLSGLLKIDQTTPQTTIGRFAFPNLAVDTNLIYTDSVNKRVGIGTTTPEAKLHISGILKVTGTTSQTSANIEFQTVGGTGLFQLDYVGNMVFRTNQAGMYFDARESASMYFRTTNSNTVRMKIENDGKIGIGTNSPTYKLDVKGASANDAINSNIGYNIQTVTAPIAPTTTVESGGSLSVGTYYYFITYTTAIGETNAGNTVQTITTTGNQKVTLTNIPISLDPRVTGRKIYRTKVNMTSDAGYYLATIADNTTTTYTDTIADTSLTGLGLQFYKVNTTATQITLNNVRSLFIDRNLTTLGVSAGNALITRNSSSIRSVFIGNGAGQNVTTGVANTVVGVAFGTATTASNCSILGDLAGYLITTGGYNTIIGAQAGRFLTTGSENVIFGSNCARYLNDNSTQLLNPTKCVYIGNGVRGFSSDETNSIVIGDTALGIGSNSVVLGNDSITKTVLKGNVGIGTTTPYGKLNTVIGNSLATGVTYSTSDFIAGTTGSMFGFKMGAVTGNTYGVINSYTTGANAYGNLILQDGGGNVGINTVTPTAKLSVGEKSAMNEVGGFMIKLTNATGANSVKGEVVDISSATDNAVVKVVDGVPDAIGVFYESGVANGAEAWVVISGIADVYFVGSTIRSQLARTFIAGEAGYVTGQALSEAVPTSQFATDKHFCEIGHILESRTGAGLAKCVLHFN